ncbi:MAG TPA: excinuclease ABC subunit UvrA [Chloroflexota bacterium]|nr:excinuclease ABC subunit UvrA [Chloroflexota bacterium]
MPQDKIVVHGAREHNLKNVDVEIPRDQLVVLTGISGSGKSTLAFDTIFAEGQRRYVESLSAYARQFLGQMEKPDVDYIEGLSPAISIDQKGVSRNPRSTVGTVTEIYDYLRLLYARIGIPHCPICGRRVTAQTVSQMVDTLLQLPPGTRFIILAPVVRGRKGEYRHVFEDARKAGYARVRVDGTIYPIDEAPELDKYKLHDIEVVVDRLVAGPELGNRLADSLETALSLGGGLVLVNQVDRGEDLLFSEQLSCPVHPEISMEQIEPRTFSFNSPRGACPACTGLGTTLEIDPDLVIPNRHLSIEDGAIVPWPVTRDGYYGGLLESVARAYGFSLSDPVEQLSEEQLHVLLYGSGKSRIPLRFHNRHRGRDLEYRTVFEGVVPNLQRRYRETESAQVKEELERYMMNRPCPECGGARLKPTSLAVTVAELNIAQLAGLSVERAVQFFSSLEPKLSEREQLIAHQILKEIRARLGFLANVGLGYLTLDRAAGTLSGGEAQRIRLATQIGSGLMGVLYILDEPSIGLHQRDNGRLIETLLRLRDLGNTLLVVEHDEETIRAADYVVDIGPGAGEHGGRIVAAGPLAKVMATPGSLTGQYLSGRRQIPIPPRRRPGNGLALRIVGARANNLKDVDVRLPLGMFVGITGVSGSGKSTLITDILYRRLAQELHRAHERPGAHERVEGMEHLDKVIDVDQSPIGRTPRSNPATYTGLFTPIRETMAKVPEARIRGYKAGRFSFNVKGGRCEACQGEGIIQIEMHFLPDVFVPCEVCKGKRYNREALEITYKGKSIADILDLTVDEAVEFFANIPAIRNKLKTLQDVGLGYIRLGQPATTLSGGEAQRVKLATELSRRATGRTLYLLDEPTTGLHFADVEKLLGVLQRLVDGGNTVVVIEHNLDVIKSCDWLIDLGPEGGDAGGEIVAEGPPEAVAADPRSHTGRYLAPLLTPAVAV